MTASISESTLKQYDSALKKWWNFCVSKNYSIFDPSIPNIIEFLSEIYKNISSFSTLNSYRAAISLICLKDISQEKTLNRFFKGVEKSKPSKPKYNKTWDVTSVFNYLSNLGTNLEMSMEILSKKTITLLAIITSQRMQTLSLIRVENIMQNNEGIEIKIPDRIKTTGKNSYQPLLKFPFFKEHPEICVCSAILCYLERTSMHRNTLNNQDNFLFLTFKKPIHTASKQTLSRWVKDTLNKSGIDTSVFSAHSTRHASTSKANQKGINIDLIRNTAGWSDKSKVFANFYNKEIINSEEYTFANAIVDDYNKN